MKTLCKSLPAHRVGALGFGLLVFTALAGCSRGDRPDLGIVSGIVTLEGEPLANVEVAFIPNNGRPSYGKTDAAGNYDLNYIRNIQGAKIGVHNVLIRSGKVDKDKMEPVTVTPGKNVININCRRATIPEPTVVEGEGEDP